MKTWLTLLLLLSTWQLTQAQNLKIDSIYQLFANDNSLKGSVASFALIDTGTDEIIYKSAPQFCVTPASVLKLITSATALELMGADYRFATQIMGTGKIQHKKLNGDLVVLGSGDPTMGSGYMGNSRNKQAFLTDWASKIKNAGIDTINGDIVANNSLYVDTEVPPTWSWEDLGQYYGAAAQSIAIYDNTFTIRFATGNAGSLTRVIGTSPQIPGITFQNEVLASDDIRDRAYIFGSPYDNFRVIKGTLPRNRNSFEVRSSIPDPALLLAQELQKALELANIVVTGTPKKSAQPIQQANLVTLLHTHYSEPLHQIIKALNFQSINLFAEHLCKHIGLIQLNEASTQAGAKAMLTYWNQRGVDTSSLFISDGSGLSRYNALTAETLALILNKMHKSSHFTNFYNSIPTAGTEGTMRNYFANATFAGSAKLKSGSMTRVRSFAGYLTTSSGKQLSLAIMVNNYPCSNNELIKKIETLLDGINQHF